MTSSGAIWLFSEVNKKIFVDFHASIVDIAIN